MSDSVEKLNEKVSETVFVLLDSCKTKDELMRALAEVQRNILAAYQAKSEDLKSNTNNSMIK